MRSGNPYLSAPLVFSLNRRTKTISSLIVYFDAEDTWPYHYQNSCILWATRKLTKYIWIQVMDHVISLEFWKRLFPECIIKPSFRSNLIISIVPIRNSSYVSPMAIISSIFTAIISILKHAIVGLVSFVNFHRLENIPFDCTTNCEKKFSCLKFYIF